MVYFVIWILFIFWYSCTIIFPNCFNNISDKKIEQERISDKSKLNFIYIKKDIFPKLRIIAITAIILFLMNAFFTIAWVLISFNLDNELIKKYCEIIYILLFIIVGTIPIIKLNLNNK